MGKIVTYAFPALFLMCVIIAWEVVVRAFDVPLYIFPPPSKVASAMADFWNPLLHHLYVTSHETLVGFGVGAAVALPVAVGITYSKFLQNALYPLLIFAQTVPKVAIAPLCLIWLGFGIESKVLLIILITIFPIVINTAAGLVAVDREAIYLIHSLKSSRWQEFSKIRFPHSLPYIFTGLKLAITLSVVGAVVGEFVGGNAGIGYLIVSASGQLDTPLMFACILILAVLGLVLYGAVCLAEKKIIPWYTPAEMRVGGA